MIEDSVLTALGELVTSRDDLDSREAQLVARARRNGATWSELAVPLGVSKQAVRKRHLAIDPIGPRRRKRPPTIAEMRAANLRVQLELAEES